MSHRLTPGNPEFRIDFLHLFNRTHNAEVTRIMFICNWFNSPPPRKRMAKQGGQGTYEVVHRMLVEADSPVDAAYASLISVQHGESYALNYEVKPPRKRKVTVDLSTDPPTVI